MTAPARALLLWMCGAGAAMGAAAPAGGASAPDGRLSFDVTEGLNLNSFLRAGPVAAHLVLRSGQDPRVLIAFPAGNSGVGLWFAHEDRPVHWRLLGRPQPLTSHDAKGRPLYGITALVTISGSALDIKQAVLSSVRVLRDYESLGRAPAEVATDPLVAGREITWARDRLDGAAGYRLSLAVIDGTLRDGHITAGPGGITLRLTALSGETPLTPLAGNRLLNDRAAADPAARRTLAFLSYQEKFLAGSWRFNTYFGRDTLMSVRLLMPVLTPAAVEAGLGAVLARISARGEVAHEEDIGEFAILDHRRADGTQSDAPVYDYKMIDGNFMLAPVVGAWLLDDPRGRRGAAAFLARSDGRQAEAPRTAGADLMTNLRFVIDSTAGFADDPQAAHLIPLKSGIPVGQWRDSNEGIGRGRYPYDVNAVLVPAALEAAGRLLASGLLEPYLRADDRALFGRAATMAAVWRAKAGPLFEVDIPNARARLDVATYARAVGVPAEAALESIGDAPVRFHAIALDADAKPVPILHSDEGFELLFGRPAPAIIEQSVTAMMRPFPAGLWTDAGVVVADPVFAAPEVQARFSKNAYHGTVIWSWQQALLAAGVARQLRRPDLPMGVKERLRMAQGLLWRAIDAGRTLRNSELWSWDFAGGRFQGAPFGASGADADESNAAQLWSTVYLAIQAPGSRSP